MSHDMEDLGQLRHFEEGVRHVLNEKAAGIDPHDRLDAILAAGAPLKRQTTYWLIGAAAMFVLVAALGIGYMLQNRSQGSMSTAGAPVQNDRAGAQSESGPSTIAPEKSSTTSVVPTGTWAMPEYEVVTGTSTHPWLLNRTFITAPDAGDLTGRVQSAITALLSGTTPDGKQIAIYGYQQPWPDGTMAKVSVTDTAITISLTGPGKTGLSADQQRIAVQSLVWTATAAAQLNVPVHIEVVGGQAIFATKPAGNYSRPASGTWYMDLVSIWIDSPTPGATLKAPVTVTGQACVFEAQFPWQVLQGSTVVKSGSAMASTACPDYGTYSITIGSLPAGTYTIRLYEISPKDGSVSYETRVPVTVA